MAMKNPVILIPGIKGTKLVNSNTLDYDVIWSVVQSYYEDIDQLKLDTDAEYDIDMNVIIKHRDLEDAGYANVYHRLKKLGYDMYIFGYDWRFSNAVNGERLKSYVETLVNRGISAQFNFVTHSMGGLVYSCFLRSLKDNYDVIDRSILVSPPFLGSLDALVSLVIGEGGSRLPFLNSRDDFRKVSRTLPAAYELLPVFPGAITRDDQTVFDIYNKDHWQSNIIDKLFTTRLSELKKFRSDGNGMLRLDDLPPQIRAKHAVIVGQGKKTNQQITVNTQRRNRFDFKQMIKSRDGDGIVPEASMDIFKMKVQTIGVKLNWAHALMMNDGRVVSLVKRFIQKQKSTATKKWFEDFGDNATQL